MDAKTYTWFVTQTELHSQQLLPNTVIQLLAGVFGVLGNSIVLLMYSRYIQDSTGSRYFIPILAVVDLAGCVSNVIEFHLEDTLQYFYPDLILCKACSFLMIMLGSLSALLIFVIALQRYLLICRPFGQQMTTGRRRVAIFVSVLLACAGATPAFHFAELRKFEVMNVTGILPSVCSFGYGSKVMLPYIGTLLFGSIITIICTVCVYIPVIRKIHKRFHSKTNQRKWGPRETSSAGMDTSVMVKTVSTKYEENFSEHVMRSTAESIPVKTIKTKKPYREQKNRYISIMFMTIIIVYIVSFVTSLITSVYETLNGKPENGDMLNMYYFFIRFNLLNHISNPYIYWFFDVKFRLELHNLFCQLHCRKRY